MPIGAKHIVAMSQRVLAGGSADLETNGLLLTKNPLISTDSIAMMFYTAQAVSKQFGPESDEYAFAAQYFKGFDNAQTSVKTLVIGRRVDKDCAAWIQSAPLTVDLAGIKKITDGAFKITVDGTKKTVASLDLSAAISLSDAATKIASAITGVTGAYDSNLNAFIFTSETTGTESTITYATSPDSGTDVSATLGLTQAEGAVLSQGADTMTEARNLDAICKITRNWVGFTTLWEATLEEDQAYSAWSDIDEDYCYIAWSTDKNLGNQQTQGSTRAAQNVNYLTNGYVKGDYILSAFALAVGAAINWQRSQGMLTWFGKSASGLTPTVTDEQEANALESIRCNYFGEFATRNAQFNMFAQGMLANTHYGFIDVLYGAIWLRNKIQRSCMDGFKRVLRVPSNKRGKAVMDGWIKDPINEAQNVGVIDKSLELNEAQKAQILEETGDDQAASDLFSRGYWYRITLPTAEERATTRGRAVLTLYYAYAGSVQSMDCEIVSVI